METSPAVRLKAPKKPKNEVPKAIPEDDVRKMHSYAVKHGMVREVCTIHLLADTGARVEGIANIERDDIDLTTGTVIVTEKGNKTRPVYLTPAGVKAVRDYLRACPMADHDFLLVGRTGKPLTHWGIRDALRKIGKVCGVQRCNPHAFRHAFAREMLEADVDMKAVSEMLGHSSIVVTADHYAIWSKKEIHNKARTAARKRALWEDS